MRARMGRSGDWKRTGSELAGGLADGLMGENNAAGDPRQRLSEHVRSAATSRTNWPTHDRAAVETVA